MKSLIIVCLAAIAMAAPSALEQELMKAYMAGYQQAQQEQQLNWFTSAVSSVSNAVSGAENAVSSTVQNVERGVGQTVQQVGQAVGQTFMSVEQQVSTIGQAISYEGRQAIGQLGSFLASHKCELIEKVCSTVVGKGLSSLGMCTLDAGMVAGACEAIGLGPEDPAADVCAGLMSTAFEGVCVAAINEIGTLSGDACAKAMGCQVSWQQQELSWFSNAFSNVEHWTSNAVKNTEQWAGNAVKNVESETQKITKAVSNTAKGAINAIGNVVGNNKCFIISHVCSTVCGKGIGSIAECTADDALVAATCEAVGLGPEDPAADVCAGAMGVAFEGVCLAAVHELGTLTGDACSKAMGC